MRHGDLRIEQAKRFRLKKEAKTSHNAPTSPARAEPENHHPWSKQKKKVFLLLFVHKKKSVLSFFLPIPVMPAQFRA